MNNSIKKPTPKIQQELFETIGRGDIQNVKKLLDAGADMFLTKKGERGRNFEWGYQNTHTAIQNAIVLAVRRNSAYFLLDLEGIGVLTANELAAMPKIYDHVMADGNNNDTEIFKFLLERWPENRSENIQFNLHNIVKKNHYGKIKTLVEAGMDVNAQDSKGKTPIMYVWSQAAAEKLIGLQADLRILDNMGHSVAWHAGHLMMNNGQRDIPDVPNLGSGYVLPFIEIIENLPLVENPDAILLVRKIRKHMKTGWLIDGIKADEHAEFSTSILPHMEIVEALDRSKMLEKHLKTNRNENAGNINPPARPKI